jgi:hypothetical protein
MKSTTAATLVLALSSLVAGQAMAADQATDTKTSQQVAAAPTAKTVAETQGKTSTDAFIELDKVKKW